MNTYVDRFRLRFVSSGPNKETLVNGRYALKLKSKRGATQCNIYKVKPNGLVDSGRVCISLERADVEAMKFALTGISAKMD